MLDKIFQHSKVKAKSAIKLFSSKKQEENNFHEYFDNKPNLLLLIKLKNSRIIGGFSREEFKPNCMGSYGFLFSLTRKEVF